MAEQLVFAALKGVVKIFQEYKKGLNELTEYKEDAEELFERVEAVLPVISRVEGRLHPDYVTSIQMAKRYMSNINAAVNDTREYVSKFSGRVGGLKLLATKAVSAMPLSSMGLNEIQTSAVQYILSKFKGNTPEKQFEKLADRLHAAVGQLNLVVNATILEGHGQDSIPEQNIMANTSPLVPSMVETPGPQSNTRLLIMMFWSSYSKPIDPGIGAKKIKISSTHLSSAAAKTSIVDMIREQFEESSGDIVGIFIPTVTIALVKHDILLLKIESDYYIMVRTFARAFLRMLPVDLEEALQLVGVLTDPRASLIKKCSASTQLFQGNLVDVCGLNPRTRMNKVYYIPYCGICIAGCFPLKSVTLSVNRPDMDTCCLKQPCEGICDHCSRETKMIFEVDFSTNVIKVNGDELQI